MKSFLKKYKEILIGLLLILIVVGIIIWQNKYYIKFEKKEDKEIENISDDKKEDKEIENISDDKKEEEKQIQIKEEKIPEFFEINNCKYKDFFPSFEQGYDYTQDMKYENKIYHKSIFNYEEYLKYKNRWNDILEMTEKDFENNFMVITAVENVSMKGLTVSAVYTQNEILYIDLDKFPEGVQYNEENPCISIIIPNEMKKENISVIDARNKDKTPDEKYGWINESFEGKKQISLEEAIQIAKDYAKQVSNTKSHMAQYVKNHDTVYEVQRVNVRPNNFWQIESFVERELEVADFTRQAFEVTLVSSKDEMQIERGMFYVDLYTGNVIAGHYMSD